MSVLWTVDPVCASVGSGWPDNAPDASSVIAKHRWAVGMLWSSNATTDVQTVTHALLHCSLVHSNNYNDKIH